MLTSLLKRYSYTQLGFYPPKMMSATLNHCHCLAPDFPGASPYIECAARVVMGPAVALGKSYVLRPSPSSRQAQRSLSPTKWIGAWGRGGGLGHWIWNLKVSGSNPPPCHKPDLFSVVQNSSPRPHIVYSQLVFLQPIGVFKLMFSLHYQQ